MGLTVTEDTPADMLAGNMELLVQLPPRIDGDYENDEIYEGVDDVDRVHQHHRNHHRHHNHHHNNGHHQRRIVNGNARRVTVARSTPMMDLLVQVATSQKLSASGYTLEAIGEHGLVLTHHPNTPIGALDAFQVKLLPKQGTFVPMKSRHVNQPFEQTFRLQVHLPRNQLYVSRVSSRMNLGKILDDVCREKNLDPNNYELCHPANIEETLDLSLSLQDYHLQEVTLCPKRRGLGSALSSQDIMALQRQEERRRQEAKQSVFGFAFKKSKESSLSTDSLGERSVSPARSDGTGRSASPQAATAPPTRPQRKRRPAPKPPMPRPGSEIKPEANAADETEGEKVNGDRMLVISHSRNSSDSSGYHEASVLSDNLDSNIRVPETLPRRSKLQPTQRESPGRTLAESSQASKSLGNLAAVPRQRNTIARGTSNSSLMSAGLRKKKAAPAPPPPRPLSSAISTQALERIVDSEESLTSVYHSFAQKASSDVAVETERESIVTRMSSGSGDRASLDAYTKGEAEDRKVEVEKKIEGREESGRDYSGENIAELINASSIDPRVSITDESVAEIIPIVHNVEPAREVKRGPGDDEAALSTVQITKGEETTSDLLKKVSDTLSGSLRSPTSVAEASASASSSLANEQQSNSYRADKPGPGDAKPRVNEAEIISELQVNENLRNTGEGVVRNERGPMDPNADSNFHDNRSQIPMEIKDSECGYSRASATTSDPLRNTIISNISSTSTDWEYVLPEPPTAFRDTNVVENRQVFTSVSPLKTISRIDQDVTKLNVDVTTLNEKPDPRFDETVKSNDEETDLTNGSRTTGIEGKILNGGIRSRTISNSSEIGGELMAVERSRSSRTGARSSVDSDSRRGSLASSTPSVAPVDNTLSNFVITTYTRPKNVDIFNEIEERKREPVVNTVRKTSNANSGNHGNPMNSDPRRSSTTTVSLDKDHSNTEGKFNAGVYPQQKFVSPQTEAPRKVDNESQEAGKIENSVSISDLDETVNRSNIRISIATKPRPRGDSMNGKQRPKSAFPNIRGEYHSPNSSEDVKPGENSSRVTVPSAPGGNKFSQWRENVMNKQENPTAEKQLQSLQVLRGILPQLDSSRENYSKESNVSETESSSNSSEEIRTQAVPPSMGNETTRNEPSVDQTSPISSSDEPRVKRYTYAGPPAINLGSWSDRSRITKVQIKPDTDYKFEKNIRPTAGEGREKADGLKNENNETASMANKISLTNLTAVKNSQRSGVSKINFAKELNIDNHYRDQTRKEPDELAKTLIARTTAGGFKRPVSTCFEPSVNIIRLKKEKDESSRKINGGIRLDDVSGKEEIEETVKVKEEKEEEIDTKPRNFKELKEAFAKDHNNTNSSAISIPKYGTFGRRSDNCSNATKIVVRRDSNLSSNGDNEDKYHSRETQGIENSVISNAQEKKSSFGIIPATAAASVTNNCNFNGVQDSVRRTSKVTLMPVVKGFKVPAPVEDEAPSTFSQEKRSSGYSRVAIGDISNGNYIPVQNGLKKILKVNKVEDLGSAPVVPKPPTMPVITGVTLKSTNNLKPRPKSMPAAEPDTRNLLLESIRNFGGQNQLRRAPGKNTNIVGSRSVRS